MAWYELFCEPSLHLSEEMVCFLLFASFLSVNHYLFLLQMSTRIRIRKKKVEGGRIKYSIRSARSSTSGRHRSSRRRSPSGLQPVEPTGLFEGFRSRSRSRDLSRRPRSRGSMQSSQGRHSEYLIRSSRGLKREEKRQGSRHHGRSRDDRRGTYRASEHKNRCRSFPLS